MHIESHPLHKSRRTLAQQYRMIHQTGEEHLKKDTYFIDQRIHSPTDDRRGITLLIRPSSEIKETIQQQLADLKTIAPEQYFYPQSDIHFTVLSIISCTPGFHLHQIEVPAYIELIGTAISQQKPFQITCQGVVLSKTGLLVCGYPEKDFLNQFRQTLREAFQSSSLRHTIDKRYKRTTAHATVMRYSNEMDNKQPFLSSIHALRNHSFGVMEVAEMELVYNNWYQQQQNTEVLHRFLLKNH